jgi:hypothetical protein
VARAVSFYTAARNVEYTLKIYDTFDGSQPNAGESYYEVDGAWYDLFNFEFEDMRAGTGRPTSA